MPYSTLLRQKIEDKGLKYREIIERCNELGETITEGYLKEIINNRKKPPSEKKNRAIAKAIEFDERQLILEAYIDKAPKEVLEIFENIVELSMLPALAKTENKVSKEEFEFLKNYINKMPLSEGLVEFLDKPELDYKDNKNFSINREGLNFSININNFSVYNVIDNSMFPKLEKGDTVSLEIKEKYVNGEILAIKTPIDKDIIYRIVLFNNNGNITLTPLNNDFKTITYNKSDIQILGKVSRIVRKI